MDPGTRDIEHLPVSTNYEDVLPLPGDRFLVAPRLGSRDRLMVVAPPGAPVPFLDTDEEARGPLTLVGDAAVAFLIGPAADQQLALASIDGRLQLRIPIRKVGSVTGLAASPDGTLYYAANGVVHRVSSTGGDSTPVNRGDEVAVDPSTGDLVILRRGNDAQLVRVPAEGGSETSIAVAGDWRVHNLGRTRSLMGHSVDSDGRLVIRTKPPASLLFPVGTLDGRTGGPIIPFLDPPDTDMFSAGWDRAGRVVALANSFRSELWRFRPVPAR